MNYEVSHHRGLIVVFIELHVGIFSLTSLKIRLSRFSQLYGRKT